LPGNQVEKLSLFKTLNHEVFELVDITLVRPFGRHGSFLRIKVVEGAEDVEIALGA
jgi:hypothetical protein